jgi:hypothetical protein
MSNKSLKDDRVVSRILNILKTGVLDWAPFYRKENIQWVKVNLQKNIS